MTAELRHIAKATPNRTARNAQYGSMGTERGERLEHAQLEHGVGRGEQRMKMDEGLGP